MSSHRQEETSNKFHNKHYMSTLNIKPTACRDYINSRIKSNGSTKKNLSV
jgi:hypothetical protein